MALMANHMMEPYKNAMFRKKMQTLNSEVS